MNARSKRTKTYSFLSLKKLSILVGNWPNIRERKIFKLWCKYYFSGPFTICENNIHCRSSQQTNLMAEGVLRICQTFSNAISGTICYIHRAGFAQAQLPLQRLCFSLALTLIAANSCHTCWFKKRIYARSRFALLQRSTFLFTIRNSVVIIVSFFQHEIVNTWLSRQKSPESQGWVRQRVAIKHHWLLP